MNLKDISATVFLALMLWREARGETYAVKCAIAQVAVNRARRPRWWGKSIQQVLFKKWQFSSLTDPADRQLTTWPAEEDAIWLQCLAIAEAAVNGEPLPGDIKGADHYYDISIPPPKWADPAKFVAQIGRVRFYRIES